jgi:ABC-type glycerol-3-phosphate transport system permease component
LCATPILVPRGWLKLLHYSLVCLAAVLFLAPVFWMISSALKPDYEIFATPPTWWPAQPRWQNFSAALAALSDPRTTRSLSLSVGEDGQVPQ